MIRFLLFGVLLLPVTSLAQPNAKPFALELEADYNFFNILRLEGPVGIGFGTRAQYKGLALGIHASYNWINFANTNDEKIRRYIRSTYLRLGASLQFRVFQFSKSSLWLRGHAYKMYWDSHKYYFLDKSTGNEIDFRCKENCQEEVDNHLNHHHSGFNYAYLWSWGGGIRYTHSFSPLVSFFGDLDLDYAYGLEYFLTAQEYSPLNTLSLTPSVGVSFNLLGIKANENKVVD